jgi:hypothetical protein
MVNTGIWKGDWKKSTTEGTRCVWKDNKMRDGKGRKGVLNRFVWLIIHDNVNIVMGIWVFIRRAIS